MSSTFSIGTPFIELQQVESTNNYATGLIHAGMAQDGAAVFAHHQTKGRGQRHKEWRSDGYKNIALSIILQPHGLPVSHSFDISKAAAVAVYRFFHNYAGEETKIKWPNDIYWRDRKAAGILIENTIQGAEWKWSVIGIGININQTTFGDVATKATSLRQITGKDYNPVQMAKEICGYVQQAWSELNSSPETISTTYKENLFRLNEAVVFKKASRLFTATVKDVTGDGRLVIDGAIEESFEVGEVEWLI